MVRVAGDAISNDCFNEYLSAKGAVQVRTGPLPGQIADLEVAEPLGFQALRDIVRQQIVIQIAKDEGVAPTAEDIQKELEFQTKLDPNFIRRLQNQGYNVGMIREQLMSSLAADRIVTKGITVTDAEIDQFVKDNPQRFTRPAEAAMLWVYARGPATRQAVDRALATGREFKQVAIELSEDPRAKEDEARFPYSVIDFMPADIRRVAQTTRVNSVSDWITLRDGTTAKFLVERRTEAEKREMTPELRESTRRFIARERGARAIDLERRINERLVTASVQVFNDRFRGRWETYIEELKEELERGGAARAPLGATAGGGETGGGETAGRETGGGQATGGN